MKFMMGIFVIILVMLSVCFFYVRGKNDSLVSLDLSQELFNSPSTFDSIMHVTTSSITGNSPKKVIGQGATEIIANNESIGGRDSISGYYDEYAFAPEDETVQILDQESLGEINYSASAPGSADEHIALEDAAFMRVESVK